MLRGVVMGLAAILVLVGSGSAYAWWRYGRIGRVDAQLDQSVRSEPQNFLIVGSDSREGIDPDSAGAEALLEGHENDGRRSDTIILLRIDAGARRVDMVSFPRDLWLTLSTGKEQRINAAYQHGPQAVIDTIQQNFDVPIHHYVEVNFVAFERLVEALDGVPIYLNRPVRDQHSGLNLPFNGCVRLDGYQALAFSRSRYLEYQSGDTWHKDGTGDEGRITRQQVFIRQALARVGELGITDVLIFDKLAAAAGESVTLDDSLSVGQLMALGKRFKDFNPDEIQSHKLVTTDHTTSGGAKVQLLDEDSAEPIFDIFRGASTPTPVTTPPVIPEEISLELLNATGKKGFGSEMAAVLREHSFVISDVGNPADGVHPTSEVRYPPGATATATMVASFFVPSPALVEDSSVEPGHVQVIVGTDHQEIESPAQQQAQQQTQQQDNSASTTSSEPANSAGTGEATATTAVPELTAPGVEVGNPPPGVKCD